MSPGLRCHEVNLTPPWGGPVRATGTEGPAQAAGTDLVQNQTEDTPQKEDSRSAPRCEHPSRGVPNRREVSPQRVQGVQLAQWGAALALSHSVAAGVPGTCARGKASSTTRASPRDTDRRPGSLTQLSWDKLSQDASLLGCHNPAMDVTLKGKWGKGPTGRGRTEGATGARAT